ncbi:4Fe-4S binding protein [Helicobacter sp.]|uniref:4Fe-4S binding protein n=1 Tax=Helicobacter sp. TaxID=218 RepID=UPI0025865C64|nr:4Fe-4S binding protein [Helicobacter sp.]MCI7046599.1 4Fe-4S binding protein [Helicobacter sp.]
MDIEKLPFGNLLLDKADINYEQKMKILNQTQEILDDFKLDSSKILELDNKLAIFYDGEEGIAASVLGFEKQASQEFEVSLFEISSINRVNGYLGNFQAELENGEIHNFSQAVMFVYDENLLRFNGFFSVADFDNPDSLMSALKQNLGEYSYKEIISYRDDFCQYHHRREKYCTKCVDACPTFGVGANDSLMELVFSPVDCVACGACVGVCPTSSLEYEELPKEGLEEIVELYQGHKVFLCDVASYKELVNQEIILDSSLTPLILPTLKILNENDLLMLLQTTQNEMIVFGEGSEAISFVNNITQQIYKRDCIVVVDSLEKINTCAKELQTFETYLYKNRYSRSHRESFAQRIQYMIKDNNFGIVKSVAPVFYGDLKIEADKCTLCLSCVGACNVNAIFAKSDDFSLRFNPSLCTTCGYCVDSCPEKIMEVSREGMRLESSYFKSRELAKDTPFLCVECKKPFSTKKSIEKIKTMLSASFSANPKKLRTIECCADCKVKVMFQDQVAQHFAEK